MRYGEAFNRLGYQLDVPRQDWTAASKAGVCITLWREEVRWGLQPSMDTRRNAGPVTEWNPAGNNKRIRHLKLALEKFDGWVDAVIVDGEPGTGVANAESWDIKVRKGMKWRVRDLDDAVGHFVAEALPFN